MRLYLRLLLLFCLTLAASTARAQTSLRVNLLGPVPGIEQRLSEYSSVELSYSPRVLGRELINGWPPFSSTGGNRFGDVRSKALTVTYKQRHLVQSDGLINGPLEKNEEAYWLISFKHTVDSRSKLYNPGAGDNDVWSSKRVAFGLAFGLGKKTNFESGITFDLATSLGAEIMEKTKSVVFYDVFSGLPNPAKNTTEHKSGVKPVFGLNISIGYTIVKKKIWVN